jgi:predicted CXXCH cytochrome family protein
MGNRQTSRFDTVSALGCLLLLIVAIAPPPLAAQENEDCLMCHGDEEATGTVGGREVSIYVDLEAFSASVHGDFGCIDCHTDLDGFEDYPHEEELQRVVCADCHDDAAADLAMSPHSRTLDDGRIGAACGACHGYHDVTNPSDRDSRANARNSRFLCGSCHPLQAEQHARSLHGQASTEGDELAPNCISCHEQHAILSHNDPSSPTNPMQIPLLCGRCHREGSEVMLQHDIPQDQILKNYSLSIHGEGLFQKGLVVTAVCTSCHTSHDILDHTDVRSSIHRDNVAATCTACHARIEEVHKKVIRGRLWEEEPNKIPSCVECHSPHKIRRRPLQPTGATNEDCFRCHSNENLTMARDGETISLFVDEDAFYKAMHAGTACAQCHNEVTITLDRPCSTIQSQVDCSICHAEVVQLYSDSTHGRLRLDGDLDAPTCLDCHEKHATLGRYLPTSKTFSLNVPELCARCHRQGEVAANRIESEIPDIVNSYSMSIHGKGLEESGLVVSASCTGCHTTHHMLPKDDPGSSINPANIAATCGTCHHGITDTFRTSIHWPEAGAQEVRKYPTCESCHTSHTISRTDTADFKFMMMDQCGHCHESEAETFFDTMHGKVSHLRGEGAAKCYDCHGTHDILPIEDPGSHLSRRNVVATCAKCHTGAHRQFTGYLTHATHHDPDKYPYLFYAFWFMTSLLVGTLTFFVIHTVAWLWRLWRTREQWRPHKHAPKEKLYMRFSRQQRVIHLVMILSFFTLALTGMSLKFSYMGWAAVLSTIMGGFETTAVLHRVAAVVLIALFVYHLKQVLNMKRESGKSWIKFIFDKNSMMFNLTDLRQFFQNTKWFLGIGARPQFGRYTYWEKFDYFAVFWGVFIIGSTGMVLWFPELFTRILPGWSVNVATIIHSDEALLAVGFIFTIHFFNTHFRPDKFPMDPVIFSGRVSLEELKHDKPVEYEDFVNGRDMEEVEKDLVPPFDERYEKILKTLGFTALGIGLTLIVLICYAMIFGYARS